MSELTNLTIDNFGAINTPPITRADYYEQAKDATITTGDVDSFTTGATITVPRGIYVVEGRWAFNTRATTGTTNSEVRIINISPDKPNGATNPITRQRVFLAGNNYNIMSVSTIFPIMAGTLSIQGSSSRATNGSGSTIIRAIKLCDY